MPQLASSTSRAQFSTWIEIHTDRLLHNLNVLRSFQRRGTSIMAVVKANGYGHGLLGVAEALAPRVDYLAVSSIREVLELRENRITAPIFLMGRLLPHEIPLVLLDGVTLMVSSFEEASNISDLSRTLGRQTRIHIKIDTGMGRLGIPFGEALKTVERIAGLPHLEAEGLFTHFPTAECEDGFAERQVENFTLLLQALDTHGITFRYRHAANSAGSLRIKSPALNMIRPGLMLYGVYPDASLRQTAAVSPVMSLKSRLISVKRLHAGQTAGYGRTFTAEKSCNIGLLPLGYSHGFPVRASGSAHVLYQGECIPVAGRVSMDYLAINLGDRTAHAGDEVTVIGQELDQSVTAEDFAEWAGTIPYEILTGLAPSIPRLCF